MITHKQAKKMHCLDLLDLAKKDDVALWEISKRADNWRICAVGDAAKSIGISVTELTDNDSNLYLWGHKFFDLVEDGKFGKAKLLYKKIANYVKKFYGTKKQLETWRNTMRNTMLFQ